MLGATSVVNSLLAVAAAAVGVVAAASELHDEFDCASCDRENSPLLVPLQCSTVDRREVVRLA
jgi:hypothetical protein